MSQYQAVFELSSLNGTNGFQISGEATSDRSAWSVSSAGDVNGDGFDDVIVGAWGADPNGSESGAAYVVFGKAAGFGATLELSSLDGTNGFQISGEAAGYNTGFSVSSAGDFNGDGFGDFIVGARNADPNGYDAGASYVVFGKASGFDATLEILTLDITEGFQIDGEAAGDQNGVSVSSAGDVNGDGFDDVIVGSSGADPNGSASGASYVVFGKASGFPVTFELSSLDGVNGFQMSGGAADDYSGTVASAGDVNGDGFDDVIVGAHGADPNGSRSGASYVVFGKASGFGATLELSSLDGANGFKLYGGADADFSGFSVSSAGDVNADGVADVIVGAYRADPNGFESGTSYVLFGKASGFAAAFTLSGLDGTNGFQLNGRAYDYSGFSVSSAGDFNGDGFDDVIVGAPNFKANGPKSGASFVVFGKAAGFGAELELSSLDGNNGFQINGKAKSDYSGRCVSAAGDVNGDGFDDLMVGARRADPNGPDSGATYVIFGSMPGEAVVRTGTDIANTIHGGNFDDTLVGLAGDDALYGHGGDDMLLSGDGDDSLSGGDGNDTLFGRDGGDSLNGGDGRDALNGDNNSDSLAGGRDKDHLNGGSGNDTLEGGRGQDTLNGGTGVDRFVYGATADSTSVNYDNVKSADFAADKFDVDGNITAIDSTIASGNLSSGQFDTELAAAVDAGHLGARHAVIFTPTAGDLAGKTFLVVDQNRVAGYQAGSDLVIELKSPVNLGSIDTGDFI